MKASIELTYQMHNVLRPLLMSSFRLQRDLSVSTTMFLSSAGFETSSGIAVAEDLSSLRCNWEPRRLDSQRHTGQNHRAIARLTGQHSRRKSPTNFGIDFGLLRIFLRTMATRQAENTMS